MTSEINLALIRYPHFDRVIDDPPIASDGSRLKVRAVREHLTFDEAPDYDVWELPIVRYIAARELGHKWTAIPVFPTRRFVQWMVEVREDSDIQVAADLQGKRVVQPYPGHTCGVLTKGVLADSYDLDLSKVSWLTSRPSELLPGRGDSQAIEGKPSELLAKGEVDAVLVSGNGNPPALGARRLWADPEREAAQWYQGSHFFPIVHVVVVTEAAVEAHPSLPGNLYGLFEQAKTDALARWDGGASLPEDKRDAAIWSGFPVPLDSGFDRRYLGADPLPYGIEENRAALQRIIGYAFEQQAIEKRYEPEELFASIEP